MKHIHSKDKFKKICEQFGEDLDSDLCEELKKSLQECPECRIQYDSIKKVVNIFKFSEKFNNIPEEVTSSLLKSLKLK